MNETNQIEEFKHVAKNYYAAIEFGNSKATSKLAKEASEIYFKIKTNKELLASMLELLKDADKSVRYFAAVYLLDTAPQKGEQELRNIISGPASPLRLLAMTSLSQWKAGTLKF